MTHGITLKHDNLSALKHLNVGPIQHITLSLVWFQHWSMMTFQHLNINAWVSSTTLLYPWFSFNTEVWRPFCTYILCMDPFHHITLALDSVSTFRCDDLCALMCWVSTRSLWPLVRCGDHFALKTFRHGSPPPQITNFQVWPFCT